MRQATFILTFMLLCPFLKAQSDSTRMVKYNPEFRFIPGVYLTFEQVKQNNPIPAIRIISNDDPFDFNFYKNLVKNKTIAFFDEFGASREVSTDQIWGYCQDGKLFIQYNGQFNRMPIIGKVCHFISDVTVIDTHYDPYYNDYYNYGYYNPYYSRPYARTSRSKETRQYLLDFETGQVMDFDRGAVEAILIQDPELYDEFMGLKKRKQNELLFFFLRRLNEKNPIFLPLRQD
jgi:hypothetical protein